MININGIRSLGSDKHISVIGIWEVASFAAIIAIKGIIRPMHLPFSEVGVFLIGTLPNFFAATGIFSCIFVYSKLLSEKHKYFQSTISRLNFSSIITFSGLSLWEVIQTFLGSNIDIYDILMSGIGCFCTYLFILTICRNDKK